MYINIITYPYIYTYCTYIYVSILYISMCEMKNMCIYICMYVCIYIYICIYMYIYIYMDKLLQVTNLKCWAVYL